MQNDYELVFDEGDFCHADRAYLCKTQETAEGFESHYGHTDIELTREQLERIMSGEILVSSVMDEYSVSIKLKSE